MSLFDKIFKNKDQKAATYEWSSENVHHGCIGISMDTRDSDSNDDLPGSILESYSRFLKDENDRLIIEIPGLSMVAIQPEYIKSLVKYSERKGYHVCDAFNNTPKNTNTNDVAKWMDYNKNSKIIIISPREMPVWLLMTMRWASFKDGIFNCSSGYGSGEKYLPFGNRSIIILMDKDGYEAFCGSVDRSYLRYLRAYPLILYDNKEW